MNPPAPSRLRLQHHRANGGVLVRLSGTIDESLDRAALLNGLEGVVVFDLDQVTQVTSFGVREWITCLQQITGQLFFVKARPAIVSQFNMVRGFGGPGRVVSIYLPYVCTSCNASFDKLLDLRTEHEVVETSTPKDANCPKCGSPAEFDDIPDSYLSYVAKQPRPQPPPVFEALLSAEVSTPEQTSLQVEKEVNGALTGIWLSGTLDGKDYFKRLADGIEGALLLSMEGVARFLPEGLDRVCAFLARLEVPITLVDIPIQLADRIALMPELADREIGVRTVVAEFLCNEHERNVVSLSLAALKQSAPLVLCSRCRKPMKGSFPESMLASARLLTVAKPSAEEASLIQAHSMGHSELTSVKTPTAGQLVPGTVVMGRYRFEKLLGAGGMAEVFLARQTAIGGFEKLVVIKRILPGLAREATFVEMFLAEARVAARIIHPNVVQIQDVGRDAGQYFIVMEYINGWDLAVVLRRCAALGMKLPISVAMGIVLDLARALHAAHTSVDAQGQRSPVIHRDVSPHNVLVGRDGTVKLTDFGIAKAADCLTVTPTSVVKGKTAYLAPEVINASMRSLVAPSIDLFALGIVAYQLLTGENPFRRESDNATLTAILHETPPLASTLRSAVPVPVAQLIARTLEKDVAVRIASAEDIANELSKLIAAYRPAAPEPTLGAWLSELEMKAAQAPAVTTREAIVTSTIDPLG